jgi:ketosteroid isomerase-like protein
MNVVRLRTLASALVIAAFTLGATPAGPMVTVNAFVTAFNKDDVKGELAACAPQAGIIDDFPPHAWMSCAAWESAFEAFNKQDGDTGPKVTLGTPWHVAVTGDVAYVVVPTTYSYKHKGSAVTQNGSVWTLVLKKTSSGWLITAWAWADGK